MAEIIPQEFADFTEHDGLFPYAKLSETSRDLRGEPERVSLRFVALSLFVPVVVAFGMLPIFGIPFGKVAMEFLGMLTTLSLGVLAFNWYENYRFRVSQGTCFVLNKSNGRLHLVAANTTLEPKQVQRIVEYYGWYWCYKNQAVRTCEISILAHVEDGTRRLRVVMIGPRCASRLSKRLASTFHVPRTVVTMAIPSHRSATGRDGRIGITQLVHRFAHRCPRSTLMPTAESTIEVRPAGPFRCHDPPPRLEEHYQPRRCSRCSPRAIPC